MNLTLKRAVAAIILGFATPVVAGPLEDADVAIKRHDYATALRLIRPLAEQGNANAQYSGSSALLDRHGSNPNRYQEAIAVEKNRVTAASNCNSMVPVGPWRCLPMITSALPRILSVSASH